MIAHVNTHTHTHSVGIMLLHSLPTCVFAGEFGLGVAHPLGSLAVFLVAAVLAVLVAVAPPALRYAGPVRDAVEFLGAAFNHRWQH